jgi:hypothetical protein
MGRKADVNSLRKMNFDFAQELGNGVGDHTPFRVGDQVFLRCQNYYYTGRVKAVLLDWVVLAEASWIPDAGRFAEALASGEFAEIEPYPGDCAIRLDTIDDASPWPHALPRGVK